jgi:hypothetical protein
MAWVLLADPGMARKCYTFPKTFTPLGSTLTVTVTVDGFEMDVKHSAVQAQCLCSYQFAS